jgi:chromosome segregation ATPase
VEPAGAVQIDFLYDSLAAAAASPWTALSRMFLILSVVTGALFVASMLRRPITAAERVAMAAVPVDAAAPAVAAEAPVRDPQLDEELQAAHEQLRQATEAFAFLEARMKDGSGSVPASADVEAATKRMAELEAALNRAEAEAALARSSAVTQEDLDRVRHEADERVAELERRMESSSPAVDAEAEALRTRLQEAEERAREAEAALAAIKDEDGSEPAPEPKPEASKPKARLEPVATTAPADPNDLIAELEAQVAAAETRAKEAEDEALHLSPEQNDLRARLTRSAAKKKLGPTG